MKDIRLPSDEELSWHARIKDQWVRWKERRHQLRSEGIPSPEAIDEASDYYRGLYIDKTPDPLAFSRLLRRRGVPDWANPYDVVQEDFHQIHRDGFLWADVEFLVSDLMRQATNRPEKDGEKSEEDELARRRLHNAQICWMLVLQETGGAWPRSLREIHPDNLAAITLEALFNPHLTMWGVDVASWPQRDFMR